MKYMKSVSERRHHEILTKYRAKWQLHKNVRKVRKILIKWHKLKGVQMEVKGFNAL